MTAGKSGYTMQAAIGVFAAIADATTVYIGSRFTATATTSAGTQRIYIPRAGTVRAVYLFFNQTAGSNETSTASFRLNNTTDTTISASVTNDAGQTAFNNTGLSITVAAGDYFEIKWVTPTWVTNPSSLVASASVYIEPS